MGPGDDAMSSTQHAALSTRHSIASNPYRWPWHGQFSPSRTALLLFEDAGPPAADAVVRNRLTLCHLAHEAGVLTVSLPGRGVPKPLAVPGDLVIARPTYGGMFTTVLDRQLRTRGITDLLICGSPFELGADCTMREANDLGYECLLVEDCSSGLTPATFAGAIASCRMSGGIFGATATLQDVLPLLDCGHAAGPSIH